jgi:hypothetical protein
MEGVTKCITVAFACRRRKFEKRPYETAVISKVGFSYGIDQSLRLTFVQATTLDYLTALRFDRAPHRIGL